MKPIFITAVLTLLLFSAVTYVSCKKDPCKDLICQNGGTCSAGSCLCPDGYEGSRCETRIDPCRNVTCQNGGVCNNGICECPAGFEGVECETKSSLKFFGIWSVSENCDGDTYQYQIQIQDNPADPSRVFVSNLGDYGCVIASDLVWDGVVSGNTITIRQIQCDYQMEADGRFENGTIIFDYVNTYVYGGQTYADRCKATLVK